MSTDNQSAPLGETLRALLDNEGDVGRAFRADYVLPFQPRSADEERLLCGWFVVFRNGWEHRALAQAPAPSGEAPEGWALVPKEPTEAMKKAGGHANSEWLNDNAPIGEARYAMPMESVWREMIAAAPKGASK